MIIKLNIKDSETAKKVLDLQFASYKIEAEIIGFDKLPPLLDTVDTLMKCDEVFYAYYMENSLAGMISYKVAQDVLDIHRVAVHPAYFKRGIAGQLVDFIESLETNVKRAEVCTGKENLPAVNLYLKKGYRKIKEIEVSRGIYITAFEKIIVK